MNPDVDVYVPSSFSSNLKKEISTRGGCTGASVSLSKVDIPVNPRLYEVKASRQICKDVYTTGELGTEIKEQSPVLDSGNGLYVIAGCAHPGLSAILSAASLFGTVAGIIGGFHDSQEHSLLKDLQLIGAGHCTVHKNEFREMYPESFAEIFAGYSVKV
jgi:7,8-dihydropterin-6-yl-methyl-4-(beta-D-ribofuranosyl)aminobenzene 5'-phosphate synthase